MWRAERDGTVTPDARRSAMPTCPSMDLSALLLALCAFFGGGPAYAQPSSTSPADSAPAPAPATRTRTTRLCCASKPGETNRCAADTSVGVILIRSSGQAPCLLGKTWGYDQTSVWVSDGCSAEFVVGQVTPPDTSKKPLEHIPNAGF